MDFNVSSKGEFTASGDTSEGGLVGETLALTFSQIVPPLPEGPVRLGDSWSSVRNVPVFSPGMGITNRVVNQYTLKGFERKDGKDCARIGIRTTAKLIRDVPEAGESLIGRMNGEGEYLFALKEGRMLVLRMRNTTEVTSQNLAQGAGKTTSEQAVEVQALE